MRKYTNQQRENNNAWKGDAAATQTGRNRAISWFPIEGKDCLDCGAKATERHHVDENTLNNDPSNIAFLCRRCHMKRDGRLAQLAKQARRQAVKKYEVIAFLRQRHREGWRITNDNMRNPEFGLSLGPVYKHFGTLAKALEEAGLPANKRIGWARPKQITNGSSFCKDWPGVFPGNVESLSLSPDANGVLS